MTQLKDSVLCILLCVLISFCGYAQQYHFAVEHITKADGLSNTEITSIVQDKQGFIWIGTRYGLNKFDGYSVKVYQTVPGNTSSLCDNNITALLADSRGDLWIGTENNGISVYDRSVDKFINYEFVESDINSLSANYVTSIKEDSKGNIWVGTLMGLNKFRPNTKDFARYLRMVDVEIDDSSLGKLKAQKFSSPLIQYFQQNMWMKKEYHEMAKEVSSMVSKSALESVMEKILQSCRIENRGVDIKAMDIDELDNIWFGFENDSIGKFNPARRVLSVFPISRTDKAQHISLLSLCWDSGQLWIGTKDWGLMRFDPNSKTFQSFKNSPQPKLVKSIMRDSQGHIWTGDDEGLSVYNSSNMLHRIAATEYDDKLLSADVSALLEDAQGNFWVASYQGGINLLKKNQSFIHDKFVDEVISPSGSKSVSAVLEDSQGNLWVGYFTSGIDLFLKGSKEKISFSTLRTYGLGKGSVFDIMEDSKKNIWIATYEGGLQQYDKIHRRFISYPFKSDKNMADVRSICEDRSGNLWIATPGNGVGKFSIDRKSFSFYKADYMHFDNSLATDWVNTIFCDRSGRIWSGSVNGVSVYDSVRGHFISYNANNSHLSHNQVLAITQDSEDRIWIGTENGLNLFDEKSKTFKAFTTADGLINNFIAALCTDHDGNLWISTYNGLSRLDTKTQVIKNYSNNSGLAAIEFSIGAWSAGQNDKIYFGAKSGLISFYPNRIHKNHQSPTVIITDFKLFNKSVPISENDDRFLNRHISEIKKLTLPYDQNVISFEFTAINYIDPKQNTYTYMLAGFEENWNHVGTQRTATYTNLDPGTYRFYVKAANSDGVMSPVGATLEITITPPIWLTFGAKVVYAVLFLSALYFIRRAFISRIRLRNKVELDEMKLRFFANISHELRTPLTLILAPLQQLNSSGKMNKEDQAELFEIMSSNGHRLLRLVNQLMNIYEIDAGVMKLKVSENNIVAVCHAVFVAFRYSAVKRNIVYTFESDVADMTGFFDTDKVDKILSNIISNAFKYSPNDSSIDVKVVQLEGHLLSSVPSYLIKRVEPDTRFVKITVRDTGKGVPVEYQKKVFERFFRIEDASTDTGTGIGLSLAQQLARIHKGDITIESKSGRGSEFTFWLPINAGSYENTEIETTREQLQLDVEHYCLNTQKEYQKIESSKETGESLPVLMIIEDSEDIRHYIRHAFRNNFQIVEAENGEQGFETIMEVIPDIIICDVMLPGMSGVEVCSKIKKDQRTSHIPVILLTARSSEIHQLQGLEEGAEDYITKPFNIAVLSVKIRNILSYRKRLKMALQLELQTRPKNSVGSSADDIFLKKAIDIVEKHLENIEFDVEMFCQELGMSHTNLYRKLHAVIGLSANQFIKNIRLKKAATLLESQALTVNEIAYAVGFRDPKYFSKSFRKQFGVLPSDYLKSTEFSVSSTEK